MKLCRNLYWGRSVADMKKTVRYEIKYRKFAVGYYCLTLPDSAGSLLDIIPSEQLKLKFMRKKPFKVVGIAGNKTEAMELAGKIVYDVYQRTGGFDISAYFERQ